MTLFPRWLTRKRPSPQIDLSSFLSTVRSRTFQGKSDAVSGSATVQSAFIYEEILPFYEKGKWYAPSDDQKLPFGSRNLYDDANSSSFLGTMFLSHRISAFRGSPSLSACIPLFLFIAFFFFLIFSSPSSYLRYQTHQVGDASRRKCCAA